MASNFEMETIRKIVSKDSTERLRKEFLIGQKTITAEETNKLSRGTLIAYITEMRMLARQQTSVKSFVVGFDISKVVISAKDDTEEGDQLEEEAETKVASGG